MIFLGQFVLFARRYGGALLHCSWMESARRPRDHARLVEQRITFERYKGLPQDESTG